MGQTEQVPSPRSQLRVETDLVSKTRSLQNTKQWTMSRNPVVMVSVTYHRQKSLKNIRRSVGLIIFHLYYRIITIHRWDNTILHSSCAALLQWCHVHAPPGEAVYISNINTVTPSILRRWKLQIFHVLYIMHSLNREQMSMTTSILMYCHQCVDNKCIRSPQPSYTLHLFLHFLLFCFIYETD